MKILNNDWDKVLEEEFAKPYCQKLSAFLDDEYQNQTIYPTKDNLYNALRYTTYQNTKVVILGQDPYHEEGQAIGLAFAVPEGIKVPPSLVNIYKELHRDCGIEIPKHGDLTPWAKQGVLLLNTVMTVRAHQANSHKNKGWEKLTDAIITKLNEKDEAVVFLLWGNNARAKAKLITNPKHLVLETVHPSPLSAYHGFLGCQHFSKCNQYLIENNLAPINWQL